MSDLLTTMTHGNGLVTNAGYDLDDRLTSLHVLNVATVVQGKTYGYADGMNLTSITDRVAPANNVSLWHSASNRKCPILIIRVAKAGAMQLQRHRKTDRLGA